MNIKNSLHKIVNLLFPSRCFVCNEYLEDRDYLGVCCFCVQRVKTEEQLQKCENCGNGVIDGVCQSCEHQMKNLVDIYFSFFNYGVGQKLLYACKFERRRDLVKVISDIIWDMSQDIFFWADAYLPIGNSNQWVHDRGYCVVESVLMRIAKKTKIDFYYPLSKKEDKQAVQQHFLNASQRMENMKDYFELSDINILKGKKRLLVVDDIYTTGATMSAYIKTLREQLCDDVDIRAYSFCRTPLLPN